MKMRVSTLQIGGFSPAKLPRSAVLLLALVLLEPALSPAWAASPSDCIEQGGQAICSAAQTGQWQYGLCDDAGSYVARYVAWCQVRGGVWQGLYASPSCTGQTPDAEDNLYSRSAAFTSIVHPGQVCTGADTGWGQTITSYFCWSGGPTYTNGILTRDFRSITFSCRETIRALKTRELICPKGTQTRLVGGRTVCIHPVESSCGVGNPVLPGTGRKVQVEDDLIFDGFPVRRFYSATGSIYPYASTAGATSIDTVWRDSFDIRLQPIAGSTFTVAAVSFPDGSLQYFRADGTAILPLQDNTARLRFTSHGAVLLSQGHAHLFDSAGRLAQMTTSSGRTFTLKYADGTLGPNGQMAVDSEGAPLAAPVPAGHLIEVRSFEARSLGFDRDVSGRLTRLRTPAGINPIRYAYGSDGHLSKTVYEDQSTREYLYNEPAHTAAAVLPDALTGIAIGDGSGAAVRFATFKYNGDGRAVSTEHAGGVDRHNLSFTNPGVSTTVQDPMGASRTYNFSRPAGVIKASGQSQPAGSGCLASTSNQVFDANGNVVQRDDFNQTRACFAHDARNRQVTQVEGLGSTAACPAYLALNVALPVGSRKLSSAWHPDWHLKIKVAEPGRITSYIYNGQPDPFAGSALASCAPATALLPDDSPIVVLCKQVEQATTDTDGHLGFSAALQSGVASRVQTWAYNESGQVLAAKGTRTDLDDTVNYAYYSTTTAGYTQGDLRSVMNPLRQLTTYTQYNKAGKPLEMIDPNGIVTRYTYDLRQRLTQASVAGQTTVYDYWPTGLLKRITQPDASFISYTYDAAQRLKAVQDSSGSSIEYTLDNAGNRVAETVRDASGTLRRQLTRVMDALGRVELTLMGAGP